MSGLRLDGRVAAVTGAGRGIGRAYALLLGQLGAKVVVNDLGGSTLGTGGDAAPADEVVKQIEAAGGAAVANYGDVSTVEGGTSVIDTAVEHFGGIDIVVNNAGNMVWGSLPEATIETIDAHYSGARPAARSTPCTRPGRTSSRRTTAAPSSPPRSACSG